MIAMTLARIAEVTGGQVHGDPEVTVHAPASLDSRDVPAGGLFVALAGDRADGHDFARAALDAGAAAVLSSRPVDGPGVVVDDVTIALGRLGRHAAERSGAAIVALTGSHGKTSVKDLLAHLLGAHGPTVATLGNLNNELGVPLTLLRVSEETRYLVVEMGARGIGHIASLCEIAPPDVAMVLNVGSAHVGEFGSVENIARAKGEIVESLRPGGTAVLNADDERVAAMAERVAPGAGIARFGRRADGPVDVRIEDVTLDENGEPDVTLRHVGRRWTTHVPLPGAHHGPNLAAAQTVCAALGLALDTDLDGFVAASPHRMARHVRADGAVVIDDSYNASPDAVVAALETLAAVAGRRRIAVLGEMLELGDATASEHERVGRAAASLGIDRLIAVDAGPVAAGFGPGAESVPDVESAVAALRDDLGAGDVVLVKASRGARLERVASALRDA